MLPVIERYIASVSEACCKRLFKIFHLFQTYVTSVLIWMLHMFHTYVARVCLKYFSCCNKCFHVASYKCFFWMLHMFHTHVASVCSKYFIYFRCMLHSSILCCKCFMFKRYVQRVMGHDPGGGGRGAAS